MARLRLDSVSKRYGDVAALDHLTLDVAEGEFMILVGPSGSGKTTALRLAAGLLQPSSGRVLRAAGDLGYVFQDPTLLPWRTVTGNVSLVPELHGCGRAEARARAAEAVALVGLEGFERHYPRALSGGMRMRVSLARVLTMKPPIFLFDEPFGPLDEITRERLNDELQRLFLHARFGGLFVTHSVTEAVYLSTSVIVLTSRPGEVCGRIEVPFDFPRLPTLRFDPAFAKVAREVSDALRTGMAS